VPALVVDRIRLFEYGLMESPAVNDPSYRKQMQQQNQKKKKKKKEKKNQKKRRRRRSCTCCDDVEVKKVGLALQFA